MNMKFDPETFFNVATELERKQHAQEEELRTAIGRAYYTVYGLAKVRYLIATKPQHASMPKNKEIAHFQMDYVIQGISRKIYKKWKDLQRARKLSDYEYDDSVTRDKVKQSFRRADQVLNAIRAANDSVFRRQLPSSPNS